MPFLLIVVGLALVVTAIQNTYAALGSQLTKDFFGPQGFLVWILAIIAVGALGYVSGWEKFSRWFLALILIAIILAQSKNSNVKGGLFGSLLSQIKNPFPTPATPAASATPQAPLSSPGNTLGVPNATPPGGWAAWFTAIPTFKFSNPFASP